MQWNIKRWLATLITASAALLSACGGGGSGEHETLDVVRLAKSNANLSVLAEAIDAAGLATTLSAAGPYTVFAPTNQAFLDLLAELKVSKAELLATSTIGLTIGFYDGFFGPGTGSFLVFAYVRVLGYDFLNASAAAKMINVATNLAALALFTFKGHVWWHLALPMALANIVGSLIGTRLALKHGAGFVRHVFIFVVLALICKTAYDTWLKA